MIVKSDIMHFGMTRRRFATSTVSIFYFQNQIQPEMDETENHCTNIFRYISQGNNLTFFTYIQSVRKLSSYICRGVILLHDNIKKNYRSANAS